MNELQDEVHTAFTPALSGPWKEVAGDYSMFDNEPWLRGLEGRLDVRYVLVRKDGRPAAAASCFLFRTAQDLTRIPAYYDVGFYHFRTLSGGTGPVIEQARTLPVVIVGPPLSGTEHRLLLRRDLPPADRAVVLKRLVERVEALGDEIGARLVVFAHLRLDPLREVLAIRPQAIPGFVASMMFLDLPDTFEGWLERLGKKSRKNVRREMKCLEAEGLRIDVRRIADCASYVGPLYLESLRRHPEGYGDHLEEVVKTTLAACVSATEHSRVFLTTARDGQPVGAAVALRWGDLYQAKLNAHHPEVAKRAALYFNQRTAEIQEAVREGVKAIDFGGAASESKLLWGCRARPAFSAFLPRRDSPLPEHRRFLLEQNRRLLAESRREVETYGQYEDQAEADLGPAQAWAAALE